MNNSLKNKSTGIKHAIDEDEKKLNKKTNNSRIEIDANLDEAGKKKIFMTEHFMKFDNKDLFTFHDLIVPGGKNAKLV